MNERDRALAVVLTGQEAECWELTGTLAGRLYNLPTLHETDWHDLVHTIHIIQNKLMARPAYRKYLQLAAEQADEAGEPDRQSIRRHIRPSPTTCP
jgi:hypothetical protein